jgi:FMN phosphatase YigB (HAD superfamily)
LHVGDVEELDVEGARRAGWYSALYAPEPAGEVTTEADLVVKDWRDFGAQISRFVTPGAN